MNRTETLSWLEQFGIQPTRSLGQNFLVEDRVVQRICDAACLDERDHVLEIGPGIGSLTRVLAEQAGHVTAIEIDRHVIPALKTVLKDYRNCTIIHADAMQISYAEIFTDWPGRIKVLANLPYYITTPLLVKLLTELPQAEILLLMMQKEAMERLCAEPGNKMYGPASVLARCMGSVNRLMIVRPGCYYPQPHVESAVLQIRSYRSTGQKTEQPTGPWADFALWVDQCFTQRRKTLPNSLKEAGLLQNPLQIDRFLQNLATIGLSPQIRAEAMQPEQFIRLYSLAQALPDQ